MRLLLIILLLIILLSFTTLNGGTKGDCVRRGVPRAEPASKVRYAAHLASMVVFKYFSTAFDFHLPRSIIVFSGTWALCNDVAPPRRREWVVALTGLVQPRLR